MPPRSARTDQYAAVVADKHRQVADQIAQLGDQVVAATMIDRIVHHAEVLTLTGASYRLKATGINTLPSARADNTAQ